MNNSLQECSFYTEEKTNYLLSPINIGLLSNNDSTTAMYYSAIIIKWFLEYQRMNEYFESRLVV